MIKQFDCCNQVSYMAHSEHGVVCSAPMGSHRIVFHGQGELPSCESPSAGNRTCTTCITWSMEGLWGIVRTEYHIHCSSPATTASFSFEAFIAITSSHVSIKVSRNIWLDFLSPWMTRWDWLVTHLSCEVAQSLWSVAMIRFMTIPCRSSHWALTFPYDCLCYLAFAEDHPYLLWLFD